MGLSHESTGTRERLLHKKDELLLTVYKMCAVYSNDVNKTSKTLQFHILCKFILNFILCIT